MKHQQRSYWFKRKRYGWGWTPATWQGWVTVSVYLIAILLLSAILPRNLESPAIVFRFVVPVTLLSLLLVYVSYKTGEPPRWQWGNDDEKEDE